MAKLNLGDLRLDHRRFLFIESLKAIVATDLLRLLSGGDDESIEKTLDAIESGIYEEKATTLILLEPHQNLEGVSRIVSRWSRLLKIHFIFSKPSVNLSELADELHVEFTEELVWGKYRFVLSDSATSLNIGFFTVKAGSFYRVKLGKNSLPVFLKGFGWVQLPPLFNQGAKKSVFQPDLNRVDVFAVGHHRVLPLGKVSDLRKLATLTKTIPIAKIPRLSDRVLV